VDNFSDFVKDKVEHLAGLKNFVIFLVGTDRNPVAGRTNFTKRRDFCYQYNNCISPTSIYIAEYLFLSQKTDVKLNFSDICYMKMQWMGLLPYLKFLIKRNPE